jgi:hypothetical protein
MKTFNRRDFIKTTAATGLGLSMGGAVFAGDNIVQAGKRVGIIGLDTSHSIAFTKALNAESPSADYKGYKVVAAYPYGSKTIASSADRIPGYIDQVKAMGVSITGSIRELLQQVDVVLLETNDGRLHLEQALEVFKAGKRVFIDKPIAASLDDAVAIFEASKKYNIPVFSASSLRYINGAQDLDKSKVIGADAYSPCTYEPSHPDLFWYGIHGVETLFTVMGTGCKEVTRIHTPDTDVVVGTWEGGRIGTFRGTRSGKSGYGGVVYTETGNVSLGPYGGYDPLLLEIINYFETGKVPISPEETLEIFAFMTAADESKAQGGRPVNMQEILKKAQSK